MSGASGVHEAGEDAAPIARCLSEPVRGGKALIGLDGLSTKGDEVARCWVVQQACRNSADRGKTAGRWKRRRGKLR